MTRAQVNATGTQFATFDGADNSIPPIAMGSHLDTVATGGMFDGALGVRFSLLLRMPLSLMISGHWCP
jgi:acetylornithine deacetylase/succinyl-diaminopimelate desuccinylase-like protein